MPNELNATGLQIKSVNELITDLTNGMKNIYGSDVNVDSNTPDGQLINICAEAVSDMLVLLQDAYTSFDPDEAVGVTLDQRCAINGIQRKVGTYTYVDIDVITDRALTLSGLNGNNEGEGYTVQDDSGQKYICAVTTVFSNAGTQSISFIAKEIGAIVPLPNTIQTPVDVVLGVVSINNPNQPTTTGTDGETDNELRERRKKSLSLSSSGYLDGLTGALANLDGAVGVEVLENNENVTDANGIPAHSIWAIIEGGQDKDIVNTLYQYKSAGCGMKGTETYNITTPSHGTFTAKFDRPNLSTLYIKFSLDGRVGTPAINIQWLRDEIVKNVTYKLGQAVDTADLIASIVPMVPEFYMENFVISKDGTTWTPNKIAPINPQERFVLNNGKDSHNNYYIQISTI